jgi:hypothetical protein
VITMPWSDDSTPADCIASDPISAYELAHAEMDEQMQPTKTAGKVIGDPVTLPDPQSPVD